MAGPGGVFRLPAAAEVVFQSASDVDDFFQGRKQKHYLAWFNDTLAERTPWEGVRLVNTPDNEVAFHQFWNCIPQIFGGNASLVQFVSLMSIISNEQRGDFFPRAERMGVAGHPGMAYLFDRIEGKKRSYNTLAGNQTAFQCFNDASYLAAHGTLPLSGRLARTRDARWSGEVWPVRVSTSSDPAVTGFIQQADFMKFRGRGLIQTTGRVNYRALVEFVQGYTGENSVLDFFQRRWANRLPDQVCSESTNADWDRLFQNTDLILAAEAVRLHNVNSGNYLAISPDPAIQSGTGPGSTFFMGLRVSGGENYANRFRARVAAVLAAI